MPPKTRAPGVFWGWREKKNDSSQKRVSGAAEKFARRVDNGAREEYTWLKLCLEVLYYERNGYGEGLFVTIHAEKQGLTKHFMPGTRCRVFLCAFFGGAAATEEREKFEENELHIEPIWL